MTIPTLITRRLRLEPLEPRHGRDVEAYARLWEVARYTAEVPHPYPPGGGIAFAEAVVEERRHGGGHVWVVLEKTGSEAIGSIGLDLFEDRRAAELGYIFAPWLWGRGYATEAARAVVDFAFVDLGLDALHSHAAVVNRASCRVLAKAGLRRIGNVAFDVLPERGGSMIGECYRLTRQEWRS
ncbi:MAG: GNAT family N-acetyltransferase [Proteobacteria bacterium]|nr:GNAT family N-acetyltransferase [Pseudomonadota bacterium]